MRSIKNDCSSNACCILKLAKFWQWQGIVKIRHELVIQGSQKWPEKYFPKFIAISNGEHDTMYKEVPLKLCKLLTIWKNIDVKL